MVRPYFTITDRDGSVAEVYPPLQWNELTSQSKMIADCKEWLHDHQPEWMLATINLKYHNYTATTVIKRNEL